MGFYGIIVAVREIELTLKIVCDYMLFYILLLVLIL